ncbi:MAG: hypothetical protein J6I98_03295 [Clostridia bacterium]|nr:hypothetical protein [Clostridia bacterium]
MEAWKFIDLAKSMVVNYSNAHAGENSAVIIDMDDVDIIWMHQTEEVNRAILTVIPPNGTFFEATYSVGQNEAQLDVCKKIGSVHMKF